MEMNLAQMTEEKLAQMIPISWRKCYVNLANAICHLAQKKLSVTN